MMKDTLVLTNSSLMSVGTGVKYEDPRFQLNLIQKKELPSVRPVFESTKCERLAYYRAFTSTQSKTETITSQQQKLNSFVWFYVFNVLFKSLPHGFVHYFFAAYAPEEHMFIAKMVPFCCGVKYLFIVVGFLEVISCVDIMILMFHYTSYGIIAQNPWNRCTSKNYFDKEYNQTIFCYEIQEFAAMFVNRSNKLHGPFYVHEYTGQYFQVSQVLHYRKEIEHITNSWNITVFLLIWCFVQIVQCHAWKRYFWKTLHYSQWGINFVDLCTLGYLMIKHYQYGDSGFTTKRQNLRTSWDVDDEYSPLWASDLALLAESVTAPPVIHVLTSRSTQEIDPSADSATMVISNALIYIFRGVLSVRVKGYCEAMIRTEMPDTKFNEKSWFYLWPMFWQEFYLGDIFSVLYTVFNMLCESLILVVTNICITETIVYEWPRLKRWKVTVVSTLVGILFHCATTINVNTSYPMGLWQRNSDLSRGHIIFLYFLYPVGRLVDDHTFYYGVPPTRLKIMSIRFVPFYYIFKTYMMFSSLWLVMETESVGKENSHYVWSWAVMLIPIVAGMVFISIKYLLVLGLPWSFLLRPVPKWGPRDFSVRQLRKQFDSRYYIYSEVPKLLSRYLISKKETKVYQVNVRYDGHKRPASAKTVGFSEFESKKKFKTM